jgi:C1A family cysteine protease
MEEYQQMLGFLPPTSNAEYHYHTLDTSVINGPVDWRAQKKVNAVKNQGSCGSCWAFSAVSAAESKHAIVSGQLVQLSEQQLVDCSHNSNYGCNGGMYDRAWADVQKQGGFMKSSDYPYTGKVGSCRFSASKVAAKVTGYHMVQRNSPDQLKAALAKGPVSVGIAASSKAFQSYRSGIFNDAGCGTRLDHAVTAVGWGSEGGKEFFIVRNSWGAGWGESGYIRMAAVTSGSGVCGLYQYPAYPDTN